MPDEGPDPQELRRRLSSRLAAQGAIRSPEWRAAFGRVPRHVFVPLFYRRVDRGGGVPYELVDGRHPGVRRAWLQAVYTDESLVTQLDGAFPTSSSTSPGHMALMLEALDVADGNTVLEIGTGTGYNAALMCERLGSGPVTTVDVDAALVEAARARLGAAGYAPCVAVADGAEGYPPNAPYDRIIATCSVVRVPQTWLDQTRPGGVIVADLRGILGSWSRHWSALVRIEVRADGSAHGRFLPCAGNFMDMRGGMPSLGERLRRVGNLLSKQGTARTNDLSPDVLEDEAFSIFAGLILAGVWDVRFESGEPAPDGLSEAGVRAWCLVDCDGGSWARLDGLLSRDGSLVTQGGPRKLWDELESAYRLWLELGRPSRSRYGLTVTAGGRQFVWLDSPAGRPIGELPSA